MSVKQVLVAVLVLLLVACTPPVTPTPSPPSDDDGVPTATSQPTLDGSAVVDETVARDAWWEDAVFYEVFVRSFYDSDGDGVGDLAGLTSKLDYLNDGDPATSGDLGITALWLMPIMESPSYHGYDVVDYMQVEKDYGTNEDFKTLIAEAHQRGIRVIIDLVLNHTSSEHPWFQESLTGDDAEYRDWYVWADYDPLFTGPWQQDVWYQKGDDWYYAVFWSEMPDLNYQNPEVTAAAYDAARYWIEELDADGFRLDAVRYLVEDDLLGDKPLLSSSPSTLEWLEEFHAYQVALDPDTMTVGEVWADTSEVVRYLEGDALDLAFEFNLADDILSSVNTNVISSMRSTLRRVVQDYPEGRYATFLTNHDQPRVMNQLRNDVSRAKLAAAVYMTLPGVPFIYYGEEIGMVGNKPDELIRTPMQWSAESQAGFTTGLPWESVNNDYETVNVAAQDGDTDSLLNYYRRLIRLRTEHVALRSGSFTVLECSNRQIYAFLRTTDEEQVLVVLNFSQNDLDGAELSIAQSPLAPGTYTAMDMLGEVVLASLPVADEGSITGFALPALKSRQTVVALLQQ